MTRLLDMGEKTCGYGIEDKLSWMTPYPSEVGFQSHATKEECWLLVTSCIRNILLEAHMARLPGRNGTPHDVLWDTLQIQGHPEVLAILQGHVVGHSTAIALHRALEAKVTELAKVVGTAKSTADRVAAARAKNQPNN